MKARELTTQATVLIIDDNSDLLNLCRTLLEMNDYKVLTAHGAKEAFSVLDVNKPDLILLDLRMEELSGPEFLMQLENNRPEIIESVPVVFLTAMAEVPTSKAVGFIKKPFKASEFLLSVRRFVERHRNAST